MILFTAVMLTAIAHAQSLEQTLPEPDNYAWGFTIVADARASFYTVELPLAVYRSASDLRLRDTSVYNAAGQAVPRIVDTAAGEVETRESRTPLPFAALFRDQQPDADRVRMMFEQMGAGTRIEVSSGGDGKPRPPLTGYIADLRAIDGAVDALELRWPEALPGFVGRVNVHGSDDLENWQLLGGAALADLRENGTDILQRRVALAGARQDFVRIEWQGLPQDWTLDGLTAVQVTAAPRVALRTLVLAPAGRDEDGSVLFDAGGAPRVERLRLGLGEDNAVVSARIEFRSAGDDEWRPAGDGTFFRLQRGDVPVVSEALPIESRRAGEWRVTITKGRPDTPFDLELGWRPDTLLFVAQGDGPYTLAVGRPDAATENFPEERLLGDVSLGVIAVDQGPVETAALGERFALAGERREPPPTPTDWRRILLWAGLIAAVLFVLWMSFRLARDGAKG